MTSVYEEVKDMVTNAWQLLLEVQKPIPLGRLPKGEFRTNYEKFARKVEEFEANARTFRQAFDPNKPRAFQGYKLYNEILGLVKFLRVGIENQQKWKDIVNSNKLAVESKQLAAYRSKLAELNDELTNLRDIDFPNDAVSRELGKFSIKAKTQYDTEAAEVKSRIDSFILPGDVNLDFACLDKWYVNEAEMQRCVEEIENASMKLTRETTEIEKMLEDVRAVRTRVDDIRLDAYESIEQLEAEFEQLSQEYFDLYDPLNDEIYYYRSRDWPFADKYEQVLGSYSKRADKSNAIDLLKKRIESLRRTKNNFFEIIDIIEKGDQLHSDYFKLATPYDNRYQALNDLTSAFEKIFDYDFRESETTVDFKRNFQRVQQKFIETETAITKHKDIKKRVANKYKALQERVSELNEARRRSRSLAVPFDELDAKIARLERSKTVTTSILTDRLDEIKEAFARNQLDDRPVDLIFALQDKFYLDETEIGQLDAEDRRIDQVSAEENAKIDARADQMLQFADLRTTVDSLIKQLDDRIEQIGERVQNTKQLFQSFIDQAESQELKGLTLYFVEREVQQLRRSEFKDAVLRALQIENLDAELNKARSVVERASSLIDDFDRQLEGDQRLVRTLSQISVTDDNLTDVDPLVDGMMENFASPEPSRDELVRRYRDLEQEFVQYRQLARRIEIEIQKQAQLKIDLEKAEIETSSRIAAFEKQVADEKVEAERYAAVPEDWKQINRLWRTYELLCVNGHRYTEFDNVGHWYCHQHAGQYLFGKWSCCDRTNPKDTGCVNADHRPSERPFTDQQTIYNVHEFVLEQLGSRVGIKGNTIVRYDRQAHEARSGQARKRPLLDEQRGAPSHRKVTFINPVFKDLPIEDGMVKLVAHENYFWDNNNGPKYVAGPSIALAEVERFRVERNTFAMGDVVTRIIERRGNDDYVFASSFPGGPLEYVPVRQLYRT